MVQILSGPYPSEKSERMAKYKQRCVICKQKWTLVSFYKQQPICSDCEQKLISDPIEDPEMRKMFDIDPKLYQQSQFLRSIRLNYARYGSLSKKQIEVFRKVVEEMKHPKAKEENKP